MTASHSDRSRSRSGRFETAAAPSLTRPQTPIWIGQQLDIASPLYNMAFLFIVDGEIDVEALSRAWQRVVDSSPVLRSAFIDRDGRGVAVEHPPGSCRLGRVDFSDAACAETRLRDWAIRRAERPLSLDGELVELVLADLGPGRSALYLNQHHLVTDAASTQLLFQRLSTEYADEAQSGRIAPVEIESYREAIQSVEESVPEHQRQAALDHWRRRQSEPTQPVRFYGREGSPQSSRSDRRTLELDRDQTTRLREIATESDFQGLTTEISIFTVFSTLLLAWLHRISGQRELGFDAPVHNRMTEGARRALGLFIEMFPFATELASGASFRSLGRACRGEAQRFVRFALPGTGTGEGAAHNVVLNYFPTPYADFAGLPTQVEWVHPGHGDRVHALRLQVHDFSGRGRYTLHFDANRDVFSAEAHERSIDHFERLLEAFLTDPGSEIAAVDVLADAERMALLVDFNRAESRPEPAGPVLQQILRQTRQTPDAEALRQGDRALRFGELAAAIDERAGELVAAGVAPGDRVAISMRRSIEAVVGLLAVHRAGAAYVPIDVKSPPGRIRDIVADSGAGLLLVDRDVEQPSLPPGCRAHALDPDTRPSDSARLPEVALDDLAYVIYTSGSTGRPKGVPITHAGLADYLEWAARQYVRGDRLSFALFTSAAFDLTVTSLYLPLMTGGILMIYPEPSGPVDTALIDVVGDNRVEFVKMTPSHLSLLREMDLSQSRISRLVVGGEELRTQLASQIHLQLGGRAEIYNEYGPTEAVVGCMIHRFDPATDRGVRVPIGRPADHVQIYLLNEALVPVPEGVPGELCISRLGLAAGYWNRDQLTAASFVPSPFEPDRSLYRSGDSARFVTEASIEYLGRIDRQLKISGYRLEPGEIEAVLDSHPAVRDSVVLKRAAGRQGPDGEEKIEHCRRCGLPSNYPAVSFDAEGVCDICHSYESIKDRAEAYFYDLEELEKLLDRGEAADDSEYDCMLLLSGGKDSTYALCRLVDMGYRVYAFSLDNGYISDEAKDNVRRVVEALGVDHEFATTPAMNAIFRDSLVRFSNVCNGCFKTIYTLSLNRAHEMGIPVVVTGLSRGQLFETRLSENLFRDPSWSPAEIDRAVLEARKVYHRLEDEATRSLDVELFRDDRIFEEIHVVDFYRYCDVGLDEMLAYLGRRVPWIRPSDTGRSTNCLINDVGIYIHRKERGFHNYALPYSWDVRLGHKSRDEAIEELDDDLDGSRIRSILAEVEYDENRIGADESGPELLAYYVADAVVADAELRQHLAKRLPEPVIPRAFIRLDAIPTTRHGKVELSALPAPLSVVDAEVDSLALAEGPVEEQIASIWRSVLGIGRVGVETSFFELGGNSLAAMEVTLQLRRQFAVELPLPTLFQHPTIRQLARVIEERVIAEVTALSEDEAARLTGADRQDP